MKYNRAFVGGNFEDYVRYLDSVKEYIPIELYNFIVEPERHGLCGKSLHDSRIERIEFSHNFVDDESNMIIILFGENRKFVLRFFKIKEYRIKQIAEKDGYTDLITYEIFVKNKGEKTLGFRAEFGGGEIAIVCKEIQIKERMMSNNPDFACVL